MWTKWRTSVSAGCNTSVNEYSVVHSEVRKKQNISFIDPLSGHPTNYRWHVICRWHASCSDSWHSTSPTCIQMYSALVCPRQNVSQLWNRPSCLALDVVSFTHFSFKVGGPHSCTCPCVAVHASACVWVSDNTQGRHINYQANWSCCKLAGVF